VVEELGLRPSGGRKKEIEANNKMLDRRTVELVLISLAAAFCGGLARALDHELFAVVFAAAAVTGAFGAVAALVGTGGS
jgi:hypothetical protein